MPRPDLSIRDLADANMARLPHFKNRAGGPAHTQPDGGDWSLGEWSNAVLGELGEAANIIKKLHRGDFASEEERTAAVANLGKELADTLTYLSILAVRAGIDLTTATVDKWNEISRRVNYHGRLVEIDGRYQLMESSGFLNEP